MLLFVKLPKVDFDSPGRTSLGRLLSRGVPPHWFARAFSGTRNCSSHFRSMFPGTPFPCGYSIFISQDGISLSLVPLRLADVLRSAGIGETWLCLVRAWVLTSNAPSHMHTIHTHTHSHRNINYTDANVQACNSTDTDFLVPWVIERENSPIFFIKPIPFFENL